MMADGECELGERVLNGDGEAVQRGMIGAVAFRDPVVAAFVECQLTWFGPPILHLSKRSGLRRHAVHSYSKRRYARIARAPGTLGTIHTLRGLRFPFKCPLAGLLGKCGRSAFTTAAARGSGGACE
jgi:hypothetical protein